MFDTGGLYLDSSCDRSSAIAAYTISFWHWAFYHTSYCAVHSQCRYVRSVHWSCVWPTHLVCLRVPRTFILFFVHVVLPARPHLFVSHAIAFWLYFLASQLLLHVSVRTCCYVSLFILTLATLTVPHCIQSPALTHPSFLYAEDVTFPEDSPQDMYLTTCHTTTKVGTRCYIVARLPDVHLTVPVHVELIELCLVTVRALALLALISTCRDLFALSVSLLFLFVSSCSVRVSPRVSTFFDLIYVSTCRSTTTTM